MKKLLSHGAALLLVVAILAGCMGTALAADVADAEEHIGEETEMFSFGPGVDYVCFDGAGNMYSPAVFPTLAAAKVKLGGCWEYTQCYQVFGGGAFNCYITYTDQTRCYFNVQEW